jgi:hypothetical protein
MPSQDTYFKNGQHGPRYGTGELFKEKTCIICRTIFHSLWKDKRTCSPKCSIELRHQKNNKLTRICIICRKEFEIPPAWLRKENTKGLYCSVECHWTNKFKYTDRQKKSAGQKVHRGIKNGKLQRQPCIICGNINSQAHHHKGYAKEHWLDVVWLCKKHHEEEHERLRQYGLANLL